MRTVAIAATCMAVFALAANADEAAAPPALSELLAAAQTAIDTCRASGYAVTVTVLDADFSTRLVLRSDGAADRTVEIGRRKAYTVVKTGMWPKRGLI